MELVADREIKNRPVGRTRREDRSEKSEITTADGGPGPFRRTDREPAEAVAPNAVRSAGRAPGPSSDERGRRRLDDEPALIF